MTAGDGGRVLVFNGVPTTSGIPPVSLFLESLSGSYTTTRTHQNSGDNTTRVLFWDRHLRRLAQSARILGINAPLSVLRPLINRSLLVGLDLAPQRSADREELAITAIVHARESDRELDIYLHIGLYFPPLFGDGLRLAMAGRGRELATAKYSDWVRVRKRMEKMRPPLATELLLSNDGDRILEGSVTNFFVVCGKVVSDMENKSGNIHDFEVQTAPVTDGVLPGIIRELVIEICTSKGIPIREVAPSWSDKEFWEEAFVTNSLRILQHVDVIQAPSLWEDIEKKTWKDVIWVEKQFKGAGSITTEIEMELTRRMSLAKDGI